MINPTVRTPVPGNPINILSLGAGVQSSILALMCERKELPYDIDAGIFADTVAEPRSVYVWLDWLETQLSFPVFRVSKGNLRELALRVRTAKTTGNKYTKHNIPAFLLGADGKRGMMRRHCTLDFKITVIHRQIRELARPKRGRKDVLVNQLIGISVDEAHRMKDSVKPYIRNVYPLVDAGITRAECLAWAEKNGLPTPPRSSCTFCPYHSDAEWVRLRTQEPEAFKSAVQFEKDYQQAFRETEELTGTPYLHASRLPLDQVTFKQAAQAEGFGNECEGMCGN